MHATRAVLPPGSAVYVDGEQTATFNSSAADAANGWWSGAAGAPPSAPFDIPFTLIL